MMNLNFLQPDGSTPMEEVPNNTNDHKKRQWLISFGHSQWGFKNWSWSVTKQDLGKFKVIQNYTNPWYYGLIIISDADFH